MYSQQIDEAETLSSQACSARIGLLQAETKMPAKEELTRGLSLCQALYNSGAYTPLADRLSKLIPNVQQSLDQLPQNQQQLENILTALDNNKVENSQLHRLDSYLEQLQNFIEIYVKKLKVLNEGKIPLMRKLPMRIIGELPERHIYIGVGP